MSMVEIDSMTPVSEIMSRGVVSVGPDDSLETVRRLFDRHRFHHLLVCDDGIARGVISERDLLKHLSPFVGTLSEKSRDTWTLKKRVHQVMNRTIVWAEPTTPITEAALMMAANRISCLPVLDEQSRPMGMVTTVDVLRWISCQLHPELDDGQQAGDQSDAA